MNNISATKKMYAESRVSIAKLGVQYEHRLLVPLFLIAFAIGRLSYWSFFVSLSHASDIAIESPSISSYRLAFL